MALPYLFANVTELDTPQFDDNFAAVGALGVIPCTASGTNTITLTPGANTPTVAAYTSNAPEFSFEAASTSTGAITLQVLGLGLKNVYKNNGATAAGANDFIAGSTYKVSYNSALNSAAGGWVILNQGASSASAGSVQGAFKNLKVQTTSDTAISITAGQVSCSDGSTSFNTIFAASLTINTGTVGANGIDTGAVSSSTWYYAFVIYNVNTSTAAGLISLSATAPVLPAGFSQYARVGAVITDGSSHLLRTLQYGRRAQYVIGTNPTIMPKIADSAGGAIGTYSVTSPVLASVSVAGFVPATASQIALSVAENWKGGGRSGVLVAPNTTWGGTNNGPQGSNGNIWPYWFAANGNDTAVVFWLLLETVAIAWCTGSTTQAIGCLGWEDNL